jgi:hypothetical protein
LRAVLLHIGVSRAGGHVVALTRDLDQGACEVLRARGGAPLPPTDVNAVDAKPWSLCDDAKPLAPVTASALCADAAERQAYLIFLEAEQPAVINALRGAFA